MIFQEVRMFHLIPNEDEKEGEESGGGEEKEEEEEEEERVEKPYHSSLVE